MYFIKVGNLYVSSDGTLTARQAEAMRVSVTETGVPANPPRFVKVRPHGSAPRNASQATSEPITDPENNY